VTVWTVIALAAAAAAALALFAPHARSSPVEELRRFGLEAADGAAARRAATWALTPVAVLSLGVSLVGLAVHGGGPGSGVTSLAGLGLAGAALLVGHLAARRASRRHDAQPGRRA
jgi:hypothetical protein